MGEKKELKVRLSTVVFLFIILVLVVALGVVYYLGVVKQKSGDINSNDKIVSNATNSKNIYVECEKQLKGVVYRRDLGEAAGYFIKDGVLYSGEKDLPNTHANTTGINGRVKYVVPLNKQTGETVVLTEDGKLYKNKKGVGNFGNSFEVILNNYSFLEILQIPNQEELMFLTKEGKVLTKDGELYLDLLKDGNNSEANDKTEDKNIEQPSNEYSIGKIITWTPNTTSYDFKTKKWLPNDSAEYYVATDKDKKLCIVDTEMNLVKKFEIVITDLITSAYGTEWENTLTIIQKDAIAYDIDITNFTYRQYKYASGY